MGHMHRVPKPTLPIPNPATPLSISLSLDQYDILRHRFGLPHATVQQDLASSAISALSIEDVGLHDTCATEEDSQSRCKGRGKAYRHLHQCIP
jgi:hypothetical protein